eukprot:167746_1
MIFLSLQTSTFSKHLTFKMARHSTDKHQFRYLVVLDFEATCNEPQNPSPQEVIEWPAMIIDIKNKCILKNSFHYYLKPIIHPKLSRFCTNLTGITQPMVNNGDNIFNVITKWNEFCYENNLLPNNKNKPLSCMVTCGDWDLKIMWPMQSKIVKQNILNNNSFKLILCNWTRLIQLRSEIINTIQLYYNENILLTPSLFHSWINIKDIYEQKYNKRAGGMMRCLKNLGIKHVGRHHSGIDDVKNICNIALKLLNDGAIFNCSKLNDISNDIIIKQHMIDGYIANYNQINTEIITTNMDRNKYITEYEVDEDKANDACNRCGKTGHWARECPKPKNNNDVCNRCGGRGHLIEIIIMISVIDVDKWVIGQEIVNNQEIIIMINVIDVEEEDLIEIIIMISVIDVDKWVIGQEIVNNHLIEIIIMISVIDVDKWVIGQEIVKK